MVLILSGLLADSRYFDCGDKLGFESFISFTLKDKEFGKSYKNLKNFLMKKFFSFLRVF